MYWNVDPRDVVRSVRSKSIMPANFIFGLNVLTRMQGVLMLAFSGMLMVRKIIANSDRFFAIFKYIFYTCWLILIYVLSFAMVSFWKPYVMHCETKLDRTDAIPSWCFDAIPNLFGYI